ncbi:MAG: amidohydrolase family protein [Ignavibacteriae bacterium]|nr:amidohydrolase family protein [Ignavibacteriota bacterium]
MTKLLFALIPVLIVLSQACAQHPLVLLGGTLIDGTGTEPKFNPAIIIEGSRITLVGTLELTSRDGKIVSRIRTTKGVIDVPEDADVYDVNGKVMMPGLIDAHIHYDGVERDLLQMFAWGVTSANCMVEATDRALALERETAPDSIASPQLYATTPIFTAKGGWWWGKDFRDDSTLNRFPATAKEARAQVRRVKAKGIKRIKLMYDDMRWCRDTLPPLARMKKNVMAALLDEAGRQGLIAEVHVPQMKDAKEVLAAGFTPKGKALRKDTLRQSGQIGSFGFAHGILDESISDSIEHIMIDKGTFYIPTFCVFEFLANTRGFLQHAMGDGRFQSSLPQDVVQHYLSSEYYERYRTRYPNSAFVSAHMLVLFRNTKSLVDRHVPVVMGTDMWALPGIGAHLELEYMVQAGLSQMEAIVSATKMGARFLGREASLGTIEPGKQADILLLDANPTFSIFNTRSISKIIKQGMIYDHQELIERSKKQ